MLFWRDAHISPSPVPCTPKRSARAAARRTGSDPSPLGELGPAPNACSRRTLPENERPHCNPLNSVNPSHGVRVRTRGAERGAKLRPRASSSTRSSGAEPARRRELPWRPVHDGGDRIGERAGIAGRAPSKRATGLYSKRSVCGGRRTGSHRRRIRHERPGYPARGHPARRAPRLDHPRSSRRRRHRRRARRRRLEPALPPGLARPRARPHHVDVPLVSSTRI